MPAKPAPEPARSWTWMTLAGLVLVTVLAFWPAFSADWVQWDDDRNFTEHWAWRGLRAEHLAWMFTTFHMGHYQPLSWLTLAVDWSLWGLDARGFHATNVALHVATAIAFWFLARRLLSVAGLGNGDESALRFGATCAALVFAVHPLRVESVAWITERRDVLGGLFFVLCVQAWVRYATAPADRRGRWYAAAILCALLSLLSKATAMVMPALLLVLDTWPLERLGRERGRVLVDKLPFVALTVVFGTLALRAQAAADAALYGLERHGLLERAVQAAYALAFHLGKTLWPVDLVPIREIPASILDPRYLVPATVAVGITVVLCGLRRRFPALLTAWIAYAVIASPTSGVAQAGPQLVADRYSYLATLPFAVLAGGGALLVARRARSAAGSGVALAPAAAVALVITALAVATNVQSRAWRDTRALWTHTLSIEPDSGVALHNLGSWCLVRSASAPDPRERRALLDEAQRHFERGARVAPAPKFEIGLGLVVGQLAALEPARRDDLVRESLERIERGVRLGAASGHVDTAWRFQLGAALFDAGRNVEAIRELEAVVAAWPVNPQGHRVLSLAYAAESRFGDAARHVELALRVQPSEPILWLRLGTFLARDGRGTAARAALEEALRLCGSDPTRASIAEGARAELARLSG